MLNKHFTAIINGEEGWYIARCPEVPGATGEGPTAEEARMGLSEALAMVLEGELSVALDRLMDEEFDDGAPQGRRGETVH